MVKVVRAAKMHFGFIPRSMADERAVSKWIRDWLKDHGVSDKDALTVYPVAIEHFFLRTPTERAMLQYSSTGTAKADKLTGRLRYLPRAISYWLGYEGPTPE